MPPKAPHPIDRSRLQGYVSSKRVCHAISAAYGTRLNARNMECDYYPAYNHTLSELSDFEFHADGALTVREQYDLWLSKETLNIYKLPPDAFDHANRAQQPMPAPLQPAEPAAAPPPPPAAAVAAPAAPLHAAADEQPAQPPAPAAAARTTYWERVPTGPRISKPPPRLSKDWIISDAARRAEHVQSTLTEEERVRAVVNLLSRSAVSNEAPADATLADTSTTTIDTVPDNNGKDNYPDLMLCHTHTVATEEPNDPKKLNGWHRRMKRKVLHLCFPLILEVKGCLDRTLEDDEEGLLEKVSDALAVAEEELYDYLQICFTRDVCADSVIAMSAAGPYWRWIMVKRTQIDTGLLTVSSTQYRAFLTRFRDASIFILGTQESDDELTRLRDKGLIPILEKHHWYKPTLVPNPQR